MIEHRWLLWLIGWAASAALLGVLYLVQRRTRDATAVDAGWAGAIVLCAILFAALGPGDPSHRVLIAVVAGLENLRIASLVRGRLGKDEDSRYRELRARWRERGREQTTFAIFYQAQALLAAILSIPFLLASFMVFVTGIPPAEEASLRSRGEDYRRYQRETSVLVPWFPRSSTP